MSDETLRAFLEASGDWLCDGYALDIRYLADTVDGVARVWDASIRLNPLPPGVDYRMSIAAAGVRIGQIQRYPERKARLLQVVRDATEGQIPLAKCQLYLARDESVHFSSEMLLRDRWFSPLHLRIDSTRRPPPSSMELARIDNALRRSTPPFDGLTDAAGWLGLNAPGSSAASPGITVHIGPPADLITERCQLVDDVLSLVIHAHPKLDVERIGLALREVPGQALEARTQAAESITWKRARDSRREGTAKIRLRNSDQVLAMLMIGDSVVRRQWFLDATRARNNRLLAVQYFDRDLRMIRSAVLESSDSAKFETGVAALLFLLGFTPAVQLETDAPDLVVATPSGRLAVVECTIRIADFSSKLGKLVDRRGGLAKVLEASGHPSQVAAVLVCRLPRDQIAVQSDELRSRGVVLVSGSDLLAAFDRVRVPGDPDRLLADAVEQAREAK